jgi:hypothetical protein
VIESVSSTALAPHEIFQDIIAASTLSSIDEIIQVILDEQIHSLQLL